MVSDTAQVLNNKLKVKKMQSFSDSFIKSKKSSNKFDDGVKKQPNSKKFKSSKKHFKQAEEIISYKFQ